MRQQLQPAGTQELRYEIRGIVSKARELEKLGKTIIWENIGDPIQKKAAIPEWMKEIVGTLVTQDRSYGYCDSKGELSTRSFLAERTNSKGGVQISEEDILFFNGLGDAISTIYSLLSPEARVICPSPAYSTHGSAEASHAGSTPVTYRLDPENHWYPDLEELREKVALDPGITAILIINPDNPTGMVYPVHILEEMVEIAREFGLFVIADEIYHRITYPGVRPYALSEVIGDVPGIAMKGISKEIPWPGSRCGWIEYYNRDKDADFDRFCRRLDDAKMVEVCSTTLPQLAIPFILRDERYDEYRSRTNEELAYRNQILGEYMADLGGIIFNPSEGTFYNTIVFEDGILNNDQFLPVDDPVASSLVIEWVEGVSPDTRFVYYLLASTGICVVPLSSFHSGLAGFRITLLEENPRQMQETFSRIREAIRMYLNSTPHTQVPESIVAYV